jgi:GTP cyclohydrolase I
MSFPETPMKDNGLSIIEKKVLIEAHFKIIMETLGLDLTDDSLQDTPKRVAKMYVEEIFSGLLSENFPKMTVIENKMKYGDMVSEINITLNSSCEHHFIPIIGKAHVSYIPKDKVIGLSKLNRLVDYYSKRPQVQERLTDQISSKLKELLGTEDVAIVIDAMHTCVRTRGIKDGYSYTRTSSLSGVYKESSVRAELFNAIPKFQI